MSRNFLVVDPEDRPDVLRALASDVRVQILKLLHIKGGMNVNDIAAALSLPQSTVSSNVQTLEDADLIRTESQRAKKGNQKICHSSFDQVLVMFKEDTADFRTDAIEVAMPLGLYTSCEVSAPCAVRAASSVCSMCPTLFSILTACMPASSGSRVAISNTSFQTMPSSPTAGWTS
jgi:predicted transcriptional regulator